MFLHVHICDVTSESFVNMFFVFLNWAWNECFLFFFLLAKSLWLQESWLGYLSIFWQVSLEKLNNSACYHDDELPEPGCSVSSFTWRSLLPTHALERAHCTAFGLCCFKAQIFTEFSVWGVFFFLRLDWVVLHKSTFKRLQPKSQGSLLFFLRYGCWIKLQNVAQVTWGKRRLRRRWGSWTWEEDPRRSHFCPSSRSAGF